MWRKDLIPGSPREWSLPENTGKEYVWKDRGGLQILWEWLANKMSGSWVFLPKTQKGNSSVACRLHIELAPFGERMVRRGTHIPRSKALSTCFYNSSQNPGPLEELPLKPWGLKEDHLCKPHVFWGQRDLQGSSVHRRFSRQEYQSGLPCSPPGESFQPRNQT